MQHTQVFTLSSGSFATTPSRVICNAAGFRCDRVREGVDGAQNTFGRPLMQLPHSWPELRPQTPTSIPSVRDFFLGGGCKKSDVVTQDISCRLASLGENRMLPLALASHVTSGLGTWHSRPRPCTTDTARSVGPSADWGPQRSGWGGEARDSPRDGPRSDSLRRRGPPDGAAEPEQGGACVLDQNHAASGLLPAACRSLRTLIPWTRPRTLFADPRHSTFSGAPGSTFSGAPGSTVTGAVGVGAAQYGRQACGRSCAWRV